MTTFLEIFGFVLAVLGVCAAYTASVKREIEKRAADAINFAEDMSEIDGAKDTQKMEDAVAFLKTTLPAWAKPFVTDKTLEKAIQFAFDKIEAYAQKQVEKAVEGKNAEITEEE